MGQNITLTISLKTFCVRLSLGKGVLLDLRESELQKLRDMLKRPYVVPHSPLVQQVRHDSHNSTELISLLSSRDCDFRWVRKSLYNTHYTVITRMILLSDGQQCELMFHQLLGANSQEH